VFPESIINIILYSMPLSLCFGLSALKSLETYLAMLQVKISDLTCKKEHFYNITGVRSRLNVVKFDNVMLSFF